MIKNLISMFKNKEIRNKILFTLAMLFIFRFGSGIPVPGIDTNALMQGISDNSLIGMMNLLGGGAMEKFSVFSLGVGPYITASIIIQLLAMDVIPALTEAEVADLLAREVNEKVAEGLGYFAQGRTSYRYSSVENEA